MVPVLKHIVEHTRREVAEAKRRVPLEELKERISELGRPRNFFRAVHQGFGLTRTQLRAMMVAAGADEPALIDFDEARDFKRNYPLLLAMAATMNPPVTSEQLDDLFRLADTYE